MLYSRFQDCFRTTAGPCTSEKTLVAVLESEVLECHLQCSSNVIINVRFEKILFQVIVNIYTFFINHSLNFVF